MSVREQLALIQQMADSLVETLGISRAEALAMAEDACSAPISEQFAERIAEWRVRFAEPPLWRLVEDLGA